MGVLEILKERGFVEAVTHDEELSAYLDGGRATCYIGFDPTASSLHVGSLVCIMALAHMQRNGHRPIGLVGGGTGLIGDPSGKTEMRKVITQKEVDVNRAGIRKQLARFIDFNEDKALLLDNGEWLKGLEYIPFLRDIGRHFSVNRMIKAESYKMRINSDEGLTFIEFNYMLLQAYDFMELSQRYDCLLQMGGSDQWGNIVAGIDLVRRTQQKKAFGITFPLITTSSGIKMGKTHKGAVWLDPERTPPYEYYQFWVNCDDADVARFMALFTFLPMEEIEQVKKMEGAMLNSAKAVLAWEATVIAHGMDAAKASYEAACAMFGAPEIPDTCFSSSTIPRSAKGGADAVPGTAYDRAALDKGIAAVDIFAEVGLCKSKSDARRLLNQGGGYLNDERIAAFDQLILTSHATDGEILLRAGKKKYHKLILK
ncbi:tyrosyl-tRNA synthetase [Desulfocicer vacuolatum DSM 3385]|uniref:Tyrosine--tRNA ligase n=1 Tax=Desulfocicer vacuolatum DSM 3385 TaxID=1121400 RepID=A0A1W1Z032_9BACT|nr:tyrosine--tRNA ligase [Desulfocicer vacuolatum]SMC41441.1 tyrosyl-tRNA synthetase [Desulfocicer vacuolatum DSM 3385]